MQGANAHGSFRDSHPGAGSEFGVRSEPLGARGSWLKMGGLVNGKDQNLRSISWWRLILTRHLKSSIGSTCLFCSNVFLLGPSAKWPFTVSCLGEGSPTEIDYEKKGILILTSLLEDLVYFPLLVLQGIDFTTGHMFNVFQEP